MTNLVERVARAIAEAQAQRRYGLYDYSDYGVWPPHVVRDERTNARLLSTFDRDEARALYEKLVAELPARAAIAATREPVLIWLGGYRDHLPPAAIKALQGILAETGGKQ